MRRTRSTIFLAAFVLALTVVSGSALGAGSQLTPAAPGLTATPAPVPAPAAGRPAPHRHLALPHTGFDVGPELLVAGVLGLLGAGLRARSQPAARVSPAPVRPDRR